MRRAAQSVAAVADRIWRPLLMLAIVCAVCAGSLRALGQARPSTLAVYAMCLLCAAAVPLGLIGLARSDASGAEPVTVPVPDEQEALR